MGSGVDGRAVRFVKYETSTSHCVNNVDGDDETSEDGIVSVGSRMSLCMFVVRERNQPVKVSRFEKMSTRITLEETNKCSERSQVKLHVSR